MTKGLTIIEAVKSGKNYYSKSLGLAYKAGSGLHTAEHILLTDWEIEERKIEITEGEFDRIWDDCWEAISGIVTKDEIKKRLFEK